MLISVSRVKARHDKTRQDNKTIGDSNIKEGATIEITLGKSVK